MRMLIDSDLDDYYILSLSAYFVRGTVYVIKVKKDDLRTNQHRSLYVMDRQRAVSGV